MKLQRFVTLLLMALIVSLLGACSDFDEMKSEKLFGQAQRLFDDGQEAEAEALLEQLVARYPDTQEAPLASRKLAQIKRHREVQERQEFTRILNSYRQVFNGYYSVYASYPTSVEEFDTSGYFFDTDYLAEVTLDEFQVYLLLTGDAAGFRAWAVRADKPRGYQVDGQSKALIPFEREMTLGQLEDRYQLVEQKGNLRILKPRS